MLPACRRRRYQESGRTNMSKSANALKQKLRHQSTRGRSRSTVSVPIDSSVHTLLSQGQWHPRAATGAAQMLLAVCDEKSGASYSTVAARAAQLLRGHTVSARCVRATARSDAPKNKEHAEAAKVGGAVDNRHSVVAAVFVREVVSGSQWLQASDLNQQHQQVGYAHRCRVGVEPSGVSFPARRRSSGGTRR